MDTLPAESVAANTPKNASLHPRYWRLDEMPAGQHGVVHRILGADAALHRLMAMGLCEGREVEVVQKGNPLIVRLLGARIGVSVRLAAQIQMAPCACAKCTTGTKSKAN